MPGDHATKTVRIVSLGTRHERYVFRYAAGDTPAVLDAAAAMAADPGQDFDFLDAAVLAYWMGRTLEVDASPSKSHIPVCL